MIDEQLRKEAAAIFARMGLSEEEAVALFYKRTVEAGAHSRSRKNALRPGVRRASKGEAKEKAHERALCRVGCVLREIYECIC